jgi:hypothetical protein
MTDQETTASIWRRVDPCLHSMVVDDCASCWEGVVHRQHAHIQRLRALIGELGGEESLASHDLFWFGRRYDPLPPGDEANGSSTKEQQ